MRVDVFAAGLVILYCTLDGSLPINDAIATGCPEYELLMRVQGGDLETLTYKPNIDVAYLAPAHYSPDSFSHASLFSDSHKFNELFRIQEAKAYRAAAYAVRALVDASHGAPHATPDSVPMGTSPPAESQSSAPVPLARLELNRCAMKRTCTIIGDLPEMPLSHVQAVRDAHTAAEAAYKNAKYTSFAKAKLASFEMAGVASSEQLEVWSRDVVTREAQQPALERSAAQKAAELVTLAKAAVEAYTSSFQAHLPEMASLKSEWESAVRDVPPERALDALITHLRDRSEVWSKVSYHLKTLLNRMLLLDPERRITLEEARSQLSSEPVKRQRRPVSYRSLSASHTNVGIVNGGIVNGGIVNEKKVGEIVNEKKVNADAEKEDHGAHHLNGMPPIPNGMTPALAPRFRSLGCPIPSRAALTSGEARVLPAIGQSARAGERIGARTSEWLGEGMLLTDLPPEEPTELPMNLAMDVDLDFYSLEGQPPLCTTI